MDPVGSGDRRQQGGVRSRRRPLRRPPPDTIDDLEALRAADRFRFANHLAAWIVVEDTRIVDYGYSGHGCMGSTTVRIGKREATYAGVALPELRGEPERTGTSVRFAQSVGGRTALPAPGRVNRPPFVQFKAPTVWTTLALTISADGTVHREMEGASPFPRHWVYDDEGKLEAKAGLADFKDWYRHAFGNNTPWGDEDSKVLVTAVETALERELSSTIMRGGADPYIREVKEGETLTVQGEPGTEVYLLLGPGAILGERAVLEGGRRTSTLRALTKCKVAVAAEDQLDRDALAEIGTGHRREEQR